MKENPESNSFFVSPRTMGTFDSVPLRDLVDEDDVVDPEDATEASEEKSL
jgi:hypothetical protein